MKITIARERIERVARIYNNNTDASMALGITRGSFARICRRYGIETPYMRQRRRKREVRGRGERQLLS